MSACSVKVRKVASGWQVDVVDATSLFRRGGTSTAREIHPTKKIALAEGRHLAKVFCRKGSR
jgi:hypothetical protein